jgi:DNA-binding transcriptional ArsR family regulator
VRGDADVAAAARLLAEPARAALVLALMDAEALPSGELAARAGIAPSTASEHLARLVEGHLLQVERKVADANTGSPATRWRTRSRRWR